ncbi:MAG: tetratricopeptide repeat protein, partial [Bacteroidota bacterium]
MKTAKFILIGIITIGLSSGELIASQIDSLKLVLKEYQKNPPRQQGEKMLELHFELGKALKSQGLFEEAVKSFQSALKWSEDDLSFFKIHHELGYAYRLLHNYSSAIKHSQLAHERTGERVPIRDIAKNLNLMAQANVDIGRLDEALKAQLEGLQLVEEIGDSLGIARAYSGLGRIYHYSGEMDRALENDLKALYIRSRRGSLDARYSTFADVSSSYLELGYTDSAKHYADLAYKLARETNKPYDIAFMQSHMGEIFLEEKNYANALEYIQLARISFRKLNEPFDIAESLFLMSTALDAIGNTSDAIDTLLTAQGIARRIGHLSLQTEITQRLGNYYHKNRNYRKAYVQGQEFQRLSDSMMSYDIQRDMAQLSQRYELNKESIEMSLLLQRQKVQRRNMYLAILGMGLFLLSIILLLLNYRYRLQKKAKEMMEMKNREIQVQHERLEDASKDWQILADLIYKDIHEQVKAVHDQLNHLQVSPNPESNGKGEAAMDSIHEEMAHIDESLSHLESYIKAGISDEPTEVINIAEIIKEARLSLPPSYQGLCRKIFTYDLPPFRANRRKMLLMVQQILLFSIKNRGEEPLSIEVSSKPIDCPYTGEPEFLFSFQDNGASIPKDKREEVF